MVQVRECGGGVTGEKEICYLKRTVSVTNAALVPEQVCVPYRLDSTYF